MPERKTGTFFEKALSCRLPEPPGGEVSFGYDKAVFGEKNLPGCSCFDAYIVLDLGRRNFTRLPAKGYILFFLLFLALAATKSSLSIILNCPPAHRL